MKPSVEDLHQKAIVVDGHVHITNSVLAQGIDPWIEQRTGCFDYARARRGGLDVVIEHVFVDDEYNTYNYTVKQACRLLETFHRVLDAHPDQMELALTSADVRRVVFSGKLAVILAMEGGFDMEGDLDVLRLFYRLGVRMIQFTNHDTTNALTDAAGGDPHWQGISEQGRAAIREMNRLGIVIDISHTTEATKRQIIEASETPVVTSHNGLRHFCSLEANPTDDALRAMAAKGGLIGLHSAGWLLNQKSLDWGYYVYPHGAPQPPAPPSPELIRLPNRDYGEFISKLDDQMRRKWMVTYGYGEPWRDRQEQAIQRGAPLPTVQDWADQADYVVRLVGDDHIGIGLDMMSGGHWLRDFDATSYPRLTEALVAKGFGERTILKILGENWLRVLDAAQLQ
jgi:membrane dipeptidase